MDEIKGDDKKFVKQISSMFHERPKPPAAIQEEKTADRQLYLQIRKLENEHKSKIETNLSRIKNLREKQEKLKIAMDILREVELGIPQEYTTRLNSYPQEIKTLEIEIEREKIFLNYLQTKVLPTIEK